MFTLIFTHTAWSVIFSHEARRGEEHVFSLFRDVEWGTVLRSWRRCVESSMANLLRREATLVSITNVSAVRARSSCEIRGSPDHRVMFCLVRPHGL